MFNTDGYINSSNQVVEEVWFRRSTDGVTWSNTPTTTTSDVSNYGYAYKIDTSGFDSYKSQMKFTYSSESGVDYWYATYATADEQTVYIYKAAANSTTLLPGTWTKVGKVAAATGMPHKLQPVLRRDPYGHLYNGTMMVGFSGHLQQEGPAAPYPHFDGATRLFYATPEAP
jgi:hypothetical protein